MFTGPPKSNPTIAPTIAAIKIWFPPLRPFNQFSRPTFNAANGVPMTYCTKSKVINVPPTGTKNTGTIDSIDFGNFTLSLINLQTYPAIKPDAIAPKKPAFKFLTNIPPTKPGAIPSLSDTE